jgi:hypothetical protein
MKAITPGGRMKKGTILVAGLVLLLLGCVTTSGQGELNDLLGALSDGKPLSDGDIIAGLKEALKVGTGNAVGLTSKVDGYFKNPKIKIPLPENVRKVEELMRLAGFGEQVEAFELSMNRAAERAAPEAQALFIDTVGKMTFADARKILKGRENEATLYFKEKTYQPLAQRFKPLVHQAMSEVGVTRYYQTLNAKIRNIPMTESLNMDIDQYVTQGALDGLFYMLAQEEAKIRKDPAARVTELLKRVFGSMN